MDTLYLAMNPEVLQRLSKILLSVVGPMTRGNLPLKTNVLCHRRVDLHEPVDNDIALDLVQERCTVDKAVLPSQ